MVHRHPRSRSLAALPHARLLIAFSPEVPLALRHPAAPSLRPSACRVSSLSSCLQSARLGPASALVSESSQTECFHRAQRMAFPRTISRSRHSHSRPDLLATRRRTGSSRVASHLLGSSKQATPARCWQREPWVVLRRAAPLRPARTAALRRVSLETAPALHAPPQTQAAEPQIQAAEHRQFLAEEATHPLGPGCASSRPCRRVEPHPAKLPAETADWTAAMPPFRFWECQGR
mmetsp:Transcript_34674/g.73867  ORF Transcript_34674/g.73867 Transcript_34674/m.73867 type:complete len:233 (+) Transcript_34674:1881-2579(+)